MCLPYGSVLISGVYGTGTKKAVLHHLKNESGKFGKNVELNSKIGIGNLVSGTGAHCYTTELWHWVVSHTIHFPPTSLISPFWLFHGQFPEMFCPELKYSIFCFHVYTLSDFLERV